MIHLKTLEEIKQIEYANKMVAEILSLCRERIKPGVVTEELNGLAEKYCADNGVLPSFKGYRGFPYALCISVNDEIVHGFPSDYVLKDGDIVSVDCGVNRNGYFGDAAFTKIIGEVSNKTKRLVKTTEECLNRGIYMAKPEGRLHNISNIIYKTAKKKFFNVIKEYTGHGVGFQVHEDPLVPNYVSRGTNYKLKVGLVIAIEPMLTEGKADTKVDSNGWVVRTLDGSLAAHFEHTIAILEDGPKILSSL